MGYTVQSVCPRSLEERAAADRIVDYGLAQQGVFLPVRYCDAAATNC